MPVATFIVDQDIAGLTLAANVAEHILGAAVDVHVAFPFIEVENVDALVTLTAVKRELEASSMQSLTTYLRPLRYRSRD